MATVTRRNAITFGAAGALAGTAVNRANASVDEGNQTVAVAERLTKVKVSPDKDKSTLFLASDRTLRAVVHNRGNAPVIVDLHFEGTPAGQNYPVPLAVGDSCMIAADGATVRTAKPDAQDAFIEFAPY